ncbi:LOW QUALITY PROTEIN: peroxidase 24-like [Ananas comosus]|uniref:Peroxidase n=1 Tax=Ananas comosus TaxID=4615 RepID=A0A6P5EZW5_ANACO|nr:LOW QUALITY PROTEIN: peroxidase 24-like [Ananas comosus]
MNETDLHHFQHYQNSCPSAEAIVKNITWSQVSSNPALPAKLLRLFFHDCFVKGCDASILLDNPQSEKQAGPNQSLGGFVLIDAIKAQLEKQCPGKVSCADIIALVTRDRAVSFQFKASLWQVETGRRDGTVSLASNVILPSPLSGFDGLKQSFASKGLSVSDLVALSGAHTMGRANCAFVTPRLFTFNGNGGVDPLLDAAYANSLKKTCPRAPPAAATVEMDPGGSLKFDASYFVALKKNQGLFLSDAALLQDPVAAKLASGFQDQKTFLAAFVQSVRRMGAVGALTGNAGQIRKQCRAVNS